MNKSQEQAKKMIDETVAGATARMAEKDAHEEMVQMHTFGGEPYLNAKGLITMLELNKKRKGLNKAEIAIIQRIITVIQKLREVGIQMLFHNDLGPGDVVEYVGGQSLTDPVKLEPNKEYYVEAITNGKIMDEWKPCVFLVGFDAPEGNPTQRPAFLASLFKKKLPDTEAKVVGMDATIK